MRDSDAIDGFSFAAAIRVVEVLQSCERLDETIEFFEAHLGLQLEAVFPADEPAVAVLSGHGLRLRLERGAAVPPATLRIGCEGHALPAERTLTAPNGTRIELVDSAPPLALPPLTQVFSVSRLAGNAPWGQGRAGMLYRDLIPAREGGRFIASHIRIPEAGPVPDYVHFHEIRFQMIYCYKGWVRLVYEDQGPPFVMRAGDCVLQPPGIRHRVLEASAGLEVIEIGSPAEHLTGVDHRLELPTDVRRPERMFGGQRFVFHEASNAAWEAWHVSGFDARDLGIAAATGGLAGVRVGRSRGAAPDPAPWHHDGEFLFLFVLAGKLRLGAGEHPDALLEAGDSCTIPAGQDVRMRDCESDLELLEVRLPAA